MQIFRSSDNCYCAFCRTPRKVYRKRNVSLLDVLGAAAASVATMLAIWQSFNPRVFVAWAVYLGIAEAFVQIRWRLSIVCKQCGFDPALYSKDPSAAANKVKLHLDLRKQDPKSILLAPLNLPTVTAEKAKFAEAASAGKKGGYLSRQI